MSSARLASSEKWLNARITWLAGRTSSPPSRAASSPRSVSERRMRKAAAAGDQQGNRADEDGTHTAEHPRHGLEAGPGQLLALRAGGGRRRGDGDVHPQEPLRAVRGHTRGDQVVLTGGQR